MNVSSISNLLDYSKYASGSATATDNKNESFDSMFQAAINLVNETNSYTKAAQEEQIAYSLGQTDSTADLLVAQQKANLSLQYTVAIRNSVLDSYKEIMNLQF